MGVLLKECKERHVNVISVAELHWKTPTTYEIDNWDVHMSSPCSRSKRNSVGTLRGPNDLSNEYVSDRLVVSLYKCLSTNITFIGHYAPNSRDDNPEGVQTKDAFFFDLNGVTGSVPKQDVIVVVGYLDKPVDPATNATAQRSGTDRHTLGDINENGLRHLPVGLVNNVGTGKPPVALKNIHKLTSKYQDECNDSLRNGVRDRTTIGAQWKKSLGEVSSLDTCAVIRCDQEVTVNSNTLEVLEYGERQVARNSETLLENKENVDISNTIKEPEILKEGPRMDIREMYNPQITKEGSWNDFVECVKTVKRELSKCRKENKGGVVKDAGGGGDWISEHSYQLFRKHKQAKEVNDGNTCMVLEEELKASLLKDKNTW